MKILQLSLLVLIGLTISACASDMVDLKRPEYTKSPCACLDAEWGETHV